MTTPAHRTPPPLSARGHTLDPSPHRLGWLQPVPAAERGDRAALRRRLERDGYLYFRAVLDVERILAFRQYYFGALAPHGLTAPGTDPSAGVQGTQVDQAGVRATLFGEIVPGALYADLCASPELRGFFEWFFGSQVHLHRRKLIRHVRTDETWITPAHYDLVYLRGGTDQLLSAWIPLGDCPATQGGLVYLEGSHVPFEALDRAADTKLNAQHLSFDLPALAEQWDTRWLIADYQVGDLVVHSPYLVHAALDNCDPQGRLRLSTDIRYQRAGDPIDVRWQRHWRDDDGL